jgi:nitrate reductase NapA
MKLDRREFLKRSVASSAAIAHVPVVIAQAPAADGARLKWSKAPCRFCGTGCGVTVGVRDGRVVATEADGRSEVNRGINCVKGYFLSKIMYGADRLTTPLLRMKNGRYDKHGEFAPVSWDRAFDEMATQWKRVLKEKGPTAVGMFGSGQWTVWEGYAASKLFKAGFRTNNIDPNARHCMASAVGGFMRTFGIDEPMGCYDDIEAANAFVLWGSNMAEMHPVLFSRILETKRVKPGTRLIDIATRRTPTTDYADMHVLFKPGTDLALANGILHLLVAQGRIHTAFIDENVVFRRGIEDLKQIGYGCFNDQAERYTFEDQPRPSSLEELTTFLQDYTPDKVSAISGVPVEQIEALAAIYGDLPRGTVSLWCMGVNQHVRGTWMNNLITDLHLITGKICRPGANPLSLTGQPSACGTAREVGTSSNRLPADMVVTNPDHRAEAEHIWNIPAGTISATPGPHAVDMFRALKRGDIKTMWIQTTNPWVTLPNRSRFDRTPNDGKFIVVSDIYPTPTTAIADLILPAAAWVEREGVFGNTERRTQQWNKMVDPPGEAREDAWAVIQVAKRMGLGNLFPWPDDNWHEPMFEEYRRFGVGHGKDLASYAQLRETRGMVWPVVNGKETFYRYTAGSDPYVKKATGAHFYKAVGYGEKAAFWLRPYHPPAESPDKEFPFWLTTGRVLEHWHSGSMTRRIKQLHQAVPAAYAELNRADAEEMGVKKGDRITVVSRRGRLELPVEIDGRGRPPRGTVFVPFFDEAKLINLITLDAMDNISKQPDYKKCAIRIERA